MLTLYGIKNCDSVKKARLWLDDHSLSYRFHDFRADGLSAAQLHKFADAVGWEKLLNRSSTSWRQLSPKLSTPLTAETALALMLDTPSLIKRPVLDTGTQILIGFKADLYQTLLP